MADDFPIFVISLADDLDRRASVSARLSDLDLSFTIIDAIDGRQWLHPDYEHLIDRDGSQKVIGRRMSDGEYACALSHRSIYTRILDEGLPGAVILEDDAIIEDSFEEFVKSRYYLAAPMILLDHVGARFFPGTKRRFGQIGAWVPVANTPTHATGYSLDRNIARALLKAATPVVCYADWPTALPPLNAYAVAPPPIRHVECCVLQSNLQADRFQMEQEAAPKPPKNVSRYFRRSYWRNRFSVRLMPR